MYKVVESQLREGMSEEALQTAREGRAHFEQLGATTEAASSLMTLAQVHYSQDRLEEALAAAEDAVWMFRESRNPKGEAHAQHVAAEVLLASGLFDKAVKAAESARALFGKLGLAEVEIEVMLLLTQAHMTQTALKESESLRPSRSISRGWSKAERVAREAVSLSLKLEDKRYLAGATKALAELFIMTQSSQDALRAAQEAARLFRDCGDPRGEGFALVLCAHAHIGLQENFEAKRVAHDALRIFHDRSDEKGETVANEVLAHLKTVITELPALLSEENRVPLQPTLPKQVTFHQSGGDAKKATPVSSVARVRKPGEALDLGAGVDLTMIKMKVTETTLSIIGEEEEDVEADTPLMQAGLTSNTAVLLRDELSNAIPGVNLPPTLIFDYPSVNAMADFIVDQASR